LNDQQISVVLHVCLRPRSTLSGLLLTKQHLSARSRQIVKDDHRIYSDPSRLQALQDPSDRKLIDVSDISRAFPSSEYKISIVPGPAVPHQSSLSVNLVYSPSARIPATALHGPKSPGGRGVYISCCTRGDDSHHIAVAHIQRSTSLPVGTAERELSPRITHPTPWGEACLNVLSVGGGRLVCFFLLTKHIRIESHPRHRLRESASRGSTVKCDSNPGRLATTTV
jgi:hypothetical protein